MRRVAPVRRRRPGVLGDGSGNGRDRRRVNWFVVGGLGPNTAGQDAQEEDDPEPPKSDKNYRYSLSTLSYRFAPLLGIHLRYFFGPFLALTDNNSTLPENSGRMVVNPKVFFPSMRADRFGS
jgi:hypothetical protein